MWSVTAIAALSALFVVAVAIYVHDFFEGETLVADCLDELRLNRQSLASLDDAWAANPKRSDCIVSLTTIPSRLPHIATTLKSLMRQSRAPARIVLNLPEFSKRENIPYVIPSFLESLKAVEIVRCADLGPATKVVPALGRESPMRKIIVVDDDRIYPENLVRDLEDAADRDPTAAFGMSGWVVPHDHVDRPTTILSNYRMSPPAPIRARRLKQAIPVDVLQGLSGYLVRPVFFDLSALTDYSGAPRESFYVDDVWISGHCMANRLVLPSRRYNYQPKFRRRLYRRTSLGLINRGPGGDESRHNSTVILHLAEKWRVGGRNLRPPGD
jgi:hypothetical protein